MRGLVFIWALVLLSAVFCVRFIDSGIDAMVSDKEYQSIWYIKTKPIYVSAEYGRQATLSGSYVQDAPNSIQLARPVQMAEVDLQAQYELTKVDAFLDKTL